MRAGWPNSFRGERSIDVRVTRTALPPSTDLAQPQWAIEEDNRVPRHVGVRLQGSRSALTFFALTGARLEEGRVIVATEGSLHVLGA